MGLDWAELGVLTSRGLLMRLAASGSCKATIISSDGAGAAAI